MTAYSKSHRILILHEEVPPGASEDEKDVLVEVKLVHQTLKKLGYKPTAAPVNLDLRRTTKIIEKEKPDLVFNLVESLGNTSRFLSVVPSLLEHLGVPFTGSGADALHVTTHKPLSKSLMKLHKLPTPDWQNCDEIVRNGLFLKPPCILKSIWEHASIGISEKSIHYSRIGLLKAIQGMSPRERTGFFIEQFVDGREFNISILADKGGLRVMPPAEIRFEDFGKRPKIVDYKAKWDTGSFEYHHTNRSFEFERTDSTLLRKINKLTLRSADAFNIKGYARVDFRITHDGRPYILEVNANPCISPDSGFIAACAKIGIDYTGLIERILYAI